MIRTPKLIATELLVLKARIGDKKAFDALYRLWGSIVLAHCARQLENHAEAQDAAQKVWVKVLRTIGSLNDPACFAAWLLKIARNTCIDMIRRKQSRAECAEAMQYEEPATHTKSESKMDLKKAIKCLPRDKQEVLELYYTAGFSTGEIAHILELPAGTIKSRLHTARATIKINLKTGEYHDQT